MATIIRYVNTGSTPGGDGTTNGTSGSTRAFASYGEAEAALQGSYSGDDIKVYCSGATAETSYCNIDGWSGTWTLEFIGTPVTSWDTSVYRIESIMNGFKIREDNHVILTNLQIACVRSIPNNGDDYDYYTCVTADSQSTNVTIRGCYITMLGASTAIRYGIALASTAGTKKIYNNIIEGFDNNSNSFAIFSQVANCVAYLYHNTITGNLKGLYVETDPSSLRLKNNLFQNNTNDIVNFAGDGYSFHGDSDYNVQDDNGTGAYYLPGSHTKRSTTVTFTSSTNFATSDTDAQVASNLYSDSTIPVTTDILGKPRPSSGDVYAGAYEYINMQSVGASSSASTCEGIGLSVVGNILNFAGIESGRSRDFRSLSGTQTVVSSPSHSGTYSFRINPTTTETGNGRLGKPSATGARDGELNVATLYVSFWFYVATLPASAEEEFFNILDTSGSVKSSLRITSAGVVKAYDSSTALAGTGSTAIALNTWTRIDVKSSTSAGSSSFVVRINTVEELSLSMSQGNTNNGSVRFGKITDRNGQSVDFYYDDIVLRDGEFCGSYKILALSPDANGSTAQWTYGTAPSNYTVVRTIPFDTATYVQSTTSAGQVQLFGFPTDSSVKGTVLAVKALAEVREVTSVTSSTKIRIKSGSSTVDNATGLNHSTSEIPQALVAGVDPATSRLWTPSAVGDLEAGLVEANAVAMRCYAFQLYVLFEDGPSSGAINQTFSVLSQEVQGAVIVAPTGSIAQTFSVLSQIAEGEVDAPIYHGVGAQTFSVLSQEASATVDVPNYAVAVTQNFSVLSQEVAGSVIVPNYDGSIAQTLSVLSQEAQGAVTPPPIIFAEVSQEFSVLSQAVAATHYFPSSSGAIAQTFSVLSQRSVATFLAAGSAHGVAVQDFSVLSQEVSGAVTNPTIELVDIYVMLLDMSANINMLVNREELTLTRIDEYLTQQHGGGDWGTESNSVIPELRRMMSRILETIKRK